MDTSMIVWHPKEDRPEEGSYVLLKYQEDGEIGCEPAAYENERFSCVYGGGVWSEAAEEEIIGWAYYPFDPRAGSEK